jgi:hypothetical protein
MSDYMVPPVWLLPDLIDGYKTVEKPTEPADEPLTEPELFAALRKVHRKKHVGEFTLSSVHFQGYDICVDCRMVWPCATMMLICVGCRAVWSQNWSPPRPVPTARDVASWPV